MLAGIRESAGERERKANPTQCAVDADPDSAPILNCLLEKATAASASGIQGAIVVLCGNSHCARTPSKWHWWPSVMRANDFARSKTSP